MAPQKDDTNAGNHASHRWSFGFTAQRPCSVARPRLSGSASHPNVLKGNKPKLPRTSGVVAGLSFLWWRNHNNLKLVLEHDHLAFAELDDLAGRADGSSIRRESTYESVNVVGTATLNKRPLDLRDASGKTARHLSRRVQCAVRLKVCGGTRTAEIDFAVEACDACFKSR